jgi:hypothetical protein
MKKSIFAFVLAAICISACTSSGSMANITPKEGTITVAEKGEIRFWKGMEHPSFSVTLTNNNEKQSCELYRVKSNGTEKWVSPSLIAGTSITITIPANGHLFVKNFNPNAFTFSYKIN